MGNDNSLPRVSILLLNYNGAKFIDACISSVLNQSYAAIELLVIDNDSQDDSLKIVKSNYPDVTILANSENLGFSKAMNLGIDGSDGEFILTLNVDVVLEPDFIAQAVAAAGRDERIGSISGKIYRMEKTVPPTLDSTGHVIFKNRLFNDRGESQLDRGQFNKEEEVFGTCAGVGFYRRAMLTDIEVNGEYFDTDFFIFLEDTDLSWRAQLRAWKCLYLPTAVAHHYRGGVAVRKSKLVETHNYKNRYFMLLKNDSGVSVIKYLPHFLITDTLKGAALLWRCPSALLGWGTVFKKIPIMWKKRRIIQRRRLVDRKEFEKKWLQPFNYRSWISRHINGF